MSRDSSQPEDLAAELHFQLSSIDRRNILSELRPGSLRLHEITKRLGLTGTEALRQVQRLADAQLIERLSDGKYRLTQFGTLALVTSSSLDFVSRYRRFFLDHDASLLPPEFRARLGELSGATLVASEYDSLNRATEMFKNAKDRIDVMNDRGLELHGQIMRGRVAEGLKIRWILHPDRLAELKSMLHSVENLPEIRAGLNVPGAVVATDLEAGIALRLNDGTMSNIGFFGRDAPFMKWAADLFRYEWEKAKPWHP